MAFFSNLGNYKNFGLLLIRLGLGIIFIYYGLPKLLGGPHNWEQTGRATGYVGIHFLPMLWGLLAALTETFGGFLVILGLAFRPVCLLLTITMVVAVFSQFGHGGNFGDASQALESAVTFAGFLFIGPGKYSVDKK